MVATLALSGLAVASAQATKFTASAFPTTVTAESAKGNDVLTTEAGSFECKTHFEGGLTSASETLSITPTYTECQAFGFLSTELKMNGCTYTDRTNGEMDMACPSGKVVEMHASTCAATFGPQSGLKKLELANGTGDITAKANATGIAYTVTNDGFALLVQRHRCKNRVSTGFRGSVSLNHEKGRSISIPPQQR